VSEPTDTAAADDFAPGSSGLLGVTSLLHRLKIAYVLVMLVVGMWGVLRVNREMMFFAVAWTVVCVGAAVVAVSPRTSGATFVFANLVLLCVAAGQWLGPWHEFLPFLGREIRDASRWNEIPITQRRTLVWNVCCAFALLWLSIPFYAIAAYVQAPPPRGERGKVLAVALALLGVWCAFGWLFVLVVQAFMK
jgi:hypothetical protein